LPALMLVHSSDTRRVPSLICPLDGPLVVGRGSDGPDSVTVDDHSMSRDHYRVSHHESGCLRVEDLNSTNGIMVGAQMIRSGSALIKIGEAMRAGDSIWVAVPNASVLSKGYFELGGERWVGHSGHLLNFNRRLEEVQDAGPLWLTGNACTPSQLKVARAVAAHRSLPLQVGGRVPDKDVLWFTSEESVGECHDNTVIGNAEPHEEHMDFQVVYVPSIAERAEDRIFLFEDMVHQWTDELMYRSVDIPYSLLRWPFPEGLSEFESIAQTLVRSLRPMEVLDESHLEWVGIPVCVYGAGEKRTKPNKEELVATLLEREGSVRGTAEHYEVQRTQIYRWIKTYEINLDELRDE